MQEKAAKLRAEMEAKKIAAEEAVRVAEEERVAKILAEAEGSYVKGKSYDSIIEYLNNTQLGVNEFQTIYSTKEQKYIHVGNSISSVLGIEPTHFTIEAFLGFAEENFIHPEDLPHVIRYAGVAYSVLCLPCFTFKVNQDHYKVKFRAAFPKSKNQSLQKQILSLEKKSFLTIDEAQIDLSFPNLHFDFWNVTPSPKNIFLRITILGCFPTKEIWYLKNYH